MEQLFTTFMAEFARNPVASGQGLRRLLESDPEQFFRCALPLLRTCPEIPGFPYLLTLLLMHDMIVGSLADPNLFSFDEAVAIGRQLLKIEPLLDIRLVRSLADVKCSETEGAQPADRAVRSLEILAALSDGARILPALSQLLRHPSAYVRSKAALLMGRVNKNHEWVQQRLAEADPRVRANALESLWGVQTEGSRRIFCAALADCNNRVVGNALLGLYRQGCPESIPLILDLLSHEDKDFRLTGIWVMGESGDPRFLAPLAQLLSEPDGKIRKSVFRSIGKLKQVGVRYGPTPTLSIHLMGADADSGGWMQVAAGVRHPGENSSASVIRLVPTQFVLWEDGRPVYTFEVEEQAHPEPFMLGWVLPRIPDTSAPLQQLLQQAAAQALAYKRKNDLWAVLKYSSDGPAPVAQVSSARDHSILQLTDTNQGNGPEVRYQADPAAILNAIATPGARAQAPSGAEAAVRHMIAGGLGRQARVSYHLVLVESPGMGAISDERWREIGELAHAGRTVVHSIAFVRSAAAAAACSRSGGNYLVLNSPEDLPRAFESACAVLPHRYKIRYRSPRSESGPPGTLKLQVYAEAGWGEDSSGRPANLPAIAEVA